jgi:hypothetical protein
MTDEISQNVPAPHYSTCTLGASWCQRCVAHPKGNRKSVANKDSPRSITSSHLTTEGRQPTGQSGSIRNLPMPRKDNVSTPASAQAQQDAVSEGIENFEPEGHGVFARQRCDSVHKLPWCVFRIDPGGYALRSPTRRTVLLTDRLLHAATYVYLLFPIPS